MTQCALLLLDTRMPYGSLSVGCEEHLDPAGTGSFYNEGEADIVVQHVISLLYSGIPPNDSFLARRASRLNSIVERDRSLSECHRRAVPVHRAGAASERQDR